MDYRLSITITSQKVCKLRTLGLHAANCLSENKLLRIAISSSLENDHDFLWLTTTLRCENSLWSQKGRFFQPGRQLSMHWPVTW